MIETKALTVSDLQSGSTQPAQGAAPVITVTKGTPSTIAAGTGVYFLKSASKGDKGGQYAVAYDKSAASDKLVTAAGFKPSIYQPKGQWYIKENNGMYSVVDRNTNTTIILTRRSLPFKVWPIPIHLGVAPILLRWNIKRMWI